MSICRCDIHGSYDTDYHEYCPRCDLPEEAPMTLNLGQVKEQVEEIADHFRAFRSLNYVDSNKLLTLARNLLADVRRLEQRWGESVDLVSEVEERAHKAEAQVCQLRAEVERLQKEDEAGEMVIADLTADIERLQESKKASCQAENMAALERENSALKAGYKQRGELLNRIQTHLTAENHDELPALVFMSLEKIVELQAELAEAKRALFDDTRVAGLKAKLKATREENDQLRDGPLCHCMAEAKPHLPHTTIKTRSQG